MLIWYGCRMQPDRMPWSMVTVTGDDRCSMLKTKIDVRLVKGAVRPSSIHRPNYHTIIVILKLLSSGSRVNPLKAMQRLVAERFHNRHKTESPSFKLQVQSSRQVLYEASWDHALCSVDCILASQVQKGQA